MYVSVVISLYTETEYVPFEERSWVVLGVIFNSNNHERRS